MGENGNKDICGGKSEGKWENRILNGVRIELGDVERRCGVV